MESRKNGIDDLICKAEIETQTQRTNIWIPRGKREGERNWETGTDTYTLLILCIKQVTNEIYVPSICEIVNKLLAQRTLLNALW